MKCGDEAWVYILSNKTNSVLYVGVTSNLERRVAEHKAKVIPGFTSKYNVAKLVYCESCTPIRDAIAREKQLKGWRREKKEQLILRVNPTWKDLASGQ